MVKTSLHIDCAEFYRHSRHYMKALIPSLEVQKYAGVASAEWSVPRSLKAEVWDLVYNQETSRTALDPPPVMMPMSRRLNRDAVPLHKPGVDSHGEMITYDLHCGCSFSTLFFPDYHGDVFMCNVGL